MNLQGDATQIVHRNGDRHADRECHTVGPTRRCRPARHEDKRRGDAWLTQDGKRSRSLRRIEIELRSRRSTPRGVDDARHDRPYSSPWYAKTERRVDALTLSQLGMAIAAPVLATCPALADDAQTVTISGKAELIDGDTLEIGPVRVRLHGIDALETG